MWHTCLHKLLANRSMGESRIWWGGRSVPLIISCTAVVVLIYPTLISLLGPFIHQYDNFCHWFTPVWCSTSLFNRLKGPGFYSRNLTEYHLAVYCPRCCGRRWRWNRQFSLGNNIRNRGRRKSCQMESSSQRHLGVFCHCRPSAWRSF